jgi:predicted Zn finger-like uncharacterized protein
MKIVCPKCGGKGNVDDAKVPKTGTTIRCPRCSERFQIGTEAAEPVFPPLANDEMESPSLDSLRREEPFTNNLEKQPDPASLERCSVCNQTHNHINMIRLDDAWVCAQCKPNYVQMLQQGLRRPGEMRYAGFWIRFGAKFIDGLILWGVGFILALPFAMAGGPTDGAESFMSQLATLIVQLIIPIAYTYYFIAKHQATPGKMACGLMVVMGDGARVSGARAVGRYFSEILSSLILCIGYLMSPFDEEKRALHDRICNTRVVYK